MPILFQFKKGGLKKEVMENLIKSKWWFLILLILLTGSFSLAKEKKDLSQNPAVSTEECAEENKKTPNPNTLPPSPKAILERKENNHSPLTPAPFNIQEDTQKEG